MLKRELIFLSYASEDLGKVTQIYKGLKKRGLNIWLDKADLKVGRWKPQIMKAIARSKYFVICISQAALKKTGDQSPGFQDEELQYAYEIASNQPEDKFTIVPVRIEDCDRGDHDHRISMFQQYDLFEDFEKGLDNLAVNLGGKDERTEDEKMLEAMLGKAETLYYSGEYDKALSFYEATIDYNPDKYDAWNNKGVALGNLSRHEEAIEAYEKALEIKPDKYEAWSNKGVALGNLGRHKEAIEAYEKALEIKPDKYEAWSNKGVALGNLGRHEEAIKACNKALEIKPDTYEAWSNKGTALLILGRHEEAIEAYEKALETKPDKYEAWNNKAVALGKSGRIEEAKEACNKALEIKPDKYEAWGNKGIALVILGRHEEAIKAYEKALEIKPDYQHAYVFIKKRKFDTPDGN